MDDDLAYFGCFVSDEPTELDEETAIAQSDAYLELLIERYLCNTY